ncbi:cadherin-related family member 5 isoform X2 [Tachysurus fulvidraco]|uniref:cadherin-related family member 5 isoform X2 n=1 Tax=Tachysurus fulvidraco TaxID=1234273 RepID=UPI001FEF5C52|nr:cadherin-related family member 5 isoform X2 [Tachysurus fulvidraco]
MDLKHLLSLKIVFFLQAVLINTSAQICSAPPPVEFKENNTIGETVTTISIQEGVSLNITENPHNAFGINGNLLVAIIVLDSEILQDEGMAIKITCMKNGTDPQTINAIVFVVDVNDNPPVFAQNLYTLKVDELSKIGTPVGTIAATDLDDQTRLYYRLESPMGEFGLQTNSNPEILVKKVLDYDTVKEVTLNLIAQDTPLSSTETISHTAKTTVIVIIVDINNRSPWFQPCTEFDNGATSRICLSSGYTGNVKLNEQTAGALTLKPGPVYAIDGDKEMNEPIGYTIIEGNINESFIINQQSGNITMQKPVSIAGNIKLTVMAYELENRDQFATTTVTLQVVTSSKHPPQFVKPKYEGFISEDVGVGSLVLESMSTNIPLQVQATDADFSNGVNPDIIFEVPADSDFLITPEGFIIMRRVASPGNVNLQISVVDVTNGESSTASLSVEVTTGVTTTDMPTTTNSPTSTAMNTTMATSTSKTTDMAIDITTDIVTQLTSSPYTGVPLPSGDFRTEDMIALGVSLAVALLLCFVVIGFLAYTLRRFKSDWKKLSEASIFQSSLSRGPKDGVQYTNEDFQGDEDIDSVTSKEAAELPLPRGPELRRSIPEMQHSVPPLETQHSVPNKSSDDSSTLPTVSSSQNALDNTDDEKEVKPILTKERRMEEGYKAVWFKEDVNPNDKEEVVISERDQDFNHEEDDSDYDFDEENVDDDDDDDDEYNA